MAWNNLFDPHVHIFMWNLLLTALLALPVVPQSQASPNPIADAAVQQSLTGVWVGVLEYRDYSEPATSTKRVDLPTWLTISPSGKSLIWRYTYDDGLNKILEENDTVTLDPTTNSYTEAAIGKPPSTYKVDGYGDLKDGHGLLILHGSGTDNDKPSETRITMVIRRNFLEVTEDVRPAGSSDPFAFRHLYRFTRSERPAITASHP